MLNMCIIEMKFVPTVADLGVYQRLKAKEDDFDTTRVGTFWYKLTVLISSLLPSMHMVLLSPGNPASHCECVTRRVTNQGHPKLAHNLCSSMF